jgi:hypothetical protein
VELNSHFMDKSRLRNEGSLSDRLLKFRLRRKIRERFCLFSARSAVRVWQLPEYLFSATGAASLQAWGNAPGKLTVSERALKARITEALLQSQMNRAFSAGLCACIVPGVLPQAYRKAAALALNRYRPDRRRVRFAQGFLKVIRRSLPIPAAC